VVPPVPEAMPQHGGGWRESLMPSVPGCAAPIWCSG